MHHRANPEIKEVVDALLARTWKAIRPKESYHAAIAQAAQSPVVTRLMDLAANSTAAPQVRAVATEALRKLQTWLKSPAAVSIDTARHRTTQDNIERFLARPDAIRNQTSLLPVPPADPIGSASDHIDSERCRITCARRIGQR